MTMMVFLAVQQVVGEPQARREGRGQEGKHGARRRRLSKSIRIDDVVGASTCRDGHRTTFGGMPVSVASQDFDASSFGNCTVVGFDDDAATLPERISARLDVYGSTWSGFVIAISCLDLNAAADAFARDASISRE